jgi:hypothetical protein
MEGRVVHARSHSSTKSAQGKESAVGLKAEAEAKDAKKAVNLRLPEEALMRHKVHSLAERKSLSEVVTELIETHLIKHKLIKG